MSYECDKYLRLWESHVKVKGRGHGIEMTYDLRFSRIRHKEVVEFAGHSLPPSEA